MKKFAVCLLLASCSWQATFCQAQEITAAAARQSIDRAVAALREMQTNQGGWPIFSRFTGGASALCTLALLNAGVPKDDPAVARALEYLRKLGQLDSVYAASLQTMVFATADPERYRLHIRQNVAWLEKAQSEQFGGWSYDAINKNPDNSNSQFALLALNEAARVGISVDRSVWERAARYWEQEQLKDGSWGYGGELGRGSMTCAGIASLTICHRNLLQGDAFVLNNKVVCCGPQEDDEPIRRGMLWLSRNFTVSHNPVSNDSANDRNLFYYLYGVERVGRLTGQRLIGGHDWYREGAEFLVDQQDLKGSWTSGQYQRSPHITTAFGLLFLSKGRRPVLVSKLTHLPDNDWNRHRQDLSNLTRSIEQRWRQDLTWQVIDHQRATTEDLLQSPVLFLSGRDGWQMPAKQKDTLRQYVERGGFLFAEACCGGEAFDRDFRALMAELFPNSPLRLLPPDHPVWYAEQPIAARYQRRLYGVDTCCRTGVVYCDANLGCFWELARGPDMHYPAAIQEEVEAVLGIGANVLAYATDRKLREKLDLPQPIPESDSDSGNAMARGQLAVATISHAGGSDEAPQALANLLRTAGRALQLRVSTQRLLLLPTDPTLPDYPLLFLHGRRNFSWSDKEREAIRNFVKNGGVIFGDAICASVEFREAVKRELTAAIPDAEWSRIPANHPLFSNQYKGFDLSQVSVRRPREPGTDQSTSKVEEITPKFEGMILDDQLVVIFSPLDISCALESPSSNDCEGYLSQDAAKLGVNILLYALQE